MRRRRDVLRLAVLMLLLGSIPPPVLQPVEGQTPYKWVILPSMPTPRTEVTATVIGSDVYVIGGFEEGRITSARVEIFNFVEKTWRNGPPLPTPLHHAVAVSLNGKIYVLGGYLKGWIPVDTVYIYDPKDGRWSDGPKMPRPKAAFTAQILDGKIYTVGGVTARTIGGRLIQEVLDVTEYYDPETGSWQTASPIPTPREHLASAQIRGKMYVIGGRSLTLATNTGVNEEYDPLTDTWIRKAPMPTKRGGIAGASFAGRIFVFGGESDTGTFDEAEMYNPVTDKWTRIKPMPTARHGLTAVTVWGGILVVGGGVEPGFSYSGANEFLDPLGLERPSGTTTSIVSVEDGGDGWIWWFSVVLVVLAVSSAVLYLKVRR